MAQIVRSDVFFQHLLETAPDAMIIVDYQGDIVLVNRQVESMFGYSREQLIGRKIEMLLPQRLRQRHSRHRTTYSDLPKLRAMGSGQELIGRRSDGEEFPVEISLSPLVEDGVHFVSSVIRDVSARRQMELDIRAAQQEAERANKANSAFLAAASHDLRQPVQALSLLNGALRRTVKDERALQMIASQEASLTAMTNLLNSLLDISRLDAGAVQPEWEEFPMQRLIDRLSAEFSRQAQQKGLSFESKSCTAVVRSDPSLLTEVISNLVSNAIRYTDAGDVRLVCHVLDGECQLQVEDTGIGIEKEQQDAIFTEFHQCKTAGASKEGFGLGLAIVRRLTDLLDHEISVESEPGKGSCFSVLVPIVAADDDAAKIESAAEALPENGVSGLLVLIEDDEKVADAWAMLLETEGYRVATAASAKEAAAMLPHLDETPVLLISDFHLLDESNGVDAVRAIREYYAKSIPAFIVSGDTSKVVKDARLLDNCTLMSKPVNTARLLSAAHSAIVSGQVPAD